MRISDWSSDVCSSDLYIVQESFMIYWKSRHNVSCDEKSIRNFLYVTVKHASLKWLRRQSIAEDYLNSRRNDSIEEPGVLNSLFRAEIIGRVQRVLEDLPDGCQIGRAHV